jgi:predicted GNAT family N-acyltransferase
VAAQITIKKFRFADRDLINQSNAIRSEVFIEEQRVEPELEYEYEEEGNYYLMFLDNQPIATARWRKTETGIKLERFALLKAFRNRGYGTILLREVLDDVLPQTLPVYLHSQVRAVNYYKRSGFVIEGAHFWEAGIEHVKMVYRIPGEPYEGS